jgi:hypothetical protein
MTERTGDFEFDFFDEPETEEDQSSRPREPRRLGPRRPVRPPAGFVPILRLVGLIALGIAIVVILATVISDCAGESKAAPYREYMQPLRRLAQDSEQVGSELNVALTTPGIKQAELEQQLEGLAQQQQQGVTQARELTPPAKLRAEHQRAVEALELRVSGLNRLVDTLRGTPKDANASQAGTDLAAQMQRLLASDVVWEDLFYSPTVVVLQGEDVKGVDVPHSRFLQNTDLVTQRGMTPIWTRIQGAATGGPVTGLHGNGIEEVKAQPEGKVLQAGTDNTVTATADLAFDVTVKNSGDSQEVSVPVRLTLQQTPSPITKTQTIRLINAGETKTVTFGNLGQIVQFGKPTTLKVEVEPVKGETNTKNNAYSYPVIFTLTPP